MRAKRNTSGDGIGFAALVGLAIVGSIIIWGGGIAAIAIAARWAITGELPF